MELTAYSPCPCGSGKKLKFCCHRLTDEMGRAERLVDGNQPHVALQHLEQLSRKYPNNAWIESTRAVIHLNLDESAAARDILRGLLEHQPDHELSITLMATAMYQADGMDAAKKAIHRAFQRGARKYPMVICGLASTMAMHYMERGSVMAAREHQALALRMSPEERRQEHFVQLLELDGNEQFPYPMRGSHPLPAITAPTEELQKEIRKAQKYSAIGCFSIAADLFQAVTRTIPDSAELWQSVGLCRAWDGDEIPAAQALHRAAQLASDRGMAVECETLAQIFDQRHTTDRLIIATWPGKVESLSLLLSRLDEHPQFKRQSAQDGSAVANFRILDRPHSPVSDPTQLTLESLPRYIGALAFYDADPESGEEPAVYLSGDVGKDLNVAKTLLDEVSGGLIQWSTDADQPMEAASTAAELHIFRLTQALDDDVPPAQVRRLLKAHGDHVINEAWTQQNLQALGGRTPLEAASDPALKVALAGAIYAFDTNCQIHGLSPDLAVLHTRLNVEPLPPLPLDESTQLSQLSVMQTHRLQVEELSDERLAPVVNRALLSRHRRFLYRVLQVALNRPGCEEAIDIKRGLRAMIDICVSLGYSEEALHWLQVARSKPHPDETDVEFHWTWDMTELSLRAEDPNDPKLRDLLDRFVHYYSPKIPQIRGHIERLLEKCGIPSPWESPRVMTVGGSDSAVWTPESNQPTAAPSKLWLPGD